MCSSDLNFGDEKAVADAIRLSGLNVPILVQAYPDALDRLEPATRRDAYCGKISVCNNLRQYRIPFTLRSEERRVGKEGRSRWMAGRSKKKEGKW